MRMFAEESDELDEHEIAHMQSNGESNISSHIFLWNSSNNPLNGSETNSTEEEDFYVPFHMRPETYIVPVLFGIIFIIGILGNGTLIRIFIKHRNMRNVPNMYICSLALGDILVIVFCVPFTSTVYTWDSWPYGTIVCKFSEYTKDVSVGVSVFTLTALSADRYLAIADPMRKLSGRHAKRINLLTIIGIWILSLVIALPSGLFSFVRVIEGPSHDFKICYPFPIEFGDRYPQAVVLFKFLVYYAFPLFLIATFHIIMARHLLLSTRNMPGEAQGQAKAIQARKKVARMVLAFVAIFAVCFFPSHVFFLWFYFNPNAEFSFNVCWNILRIAGFCLGFINSCINPIALYCVSATFRKHFNQHLFCCCTRQFSPKSRSSPYNKSHLTLNCGCLSRNMGQTPYSEGNRLGFYSQSGSGTVSAAKSKYTWDTQSTASQNQVMCCHSPSTASVLAPLMAKPTSGNINSSDVELKETLVSPTITPLTESKTGGFPVVIQHNASVHSSGAGDMMTTSFTTAKACKTTDASSFNVINSNMNVYSGQGNLQCEQTIQDHVRAFDDVNVNQSRNFIEC